MNERQTCELLRSWSPSISRNDRWLKLKFRLQPVVVSRDLDLWAFQHGVTLDFSRPGKPTDNAFAESFNGKVRAE